MREYSGLQGGCPKGKGNRGHTGGANAGITSLFQSLSCIRKFTLESFRQKKSVNEEDYFQQLKSAWPKKCEVPLSLIALADEAVARFPESPRLWCMRGNLMELGPAEVPHELGEALASYRRATEIDPSFAAAWEEIGHYYDAILDDEKSAAEYFAKARALKTDEPASG